MAISPSNGRISSSSLASCLRLCRQSVIEVAAQADADRVQVVVVVRSEWPLPAKSRKRPRKYTPEEKVRIVIEGIRGEISVSREGINPGVYYKWLAGRGTARVTRENERLKELVAQLSVENLVLKKSLG